MNIGTGSYTRAYRADKLAYWQTGYYRAVYIQGTIEPIHQFPFQTESKMAFSDRPDLRGEEEKKSRTFRQEESIFDMTAKLDSMLMV